MARIERFALTPLRKDEILGFAQEVETKLTLPDVASSVAYKAFASAIVKYDAALQAKGLSYEDLEEADLRVDQAVLGLRAHIQALENYPLASVRQAARHIWELLEPFGNPTRESFAEEYPVVLRMLSMLESLDASLLERATVSAWVPELRASYDAFMTVMKAYDSDRASLPTGHIKEARTALCDAWRVLCDYIDGLSAVIPSPELDALIGEINARIQSRRAILRRRRAATKASDAG